MKPGVRITGGEGKGRSLAVPPGARPTEGRVREALFSIWQERLPGARVLDLFAGSGVVGLEAVGRGALSAVCADEDPRSVKAIERNAAALGTPVTIRRLPLPAGLARLAREGPFDLIFADPPYAFQDYGKLLAAAASLLASDGEIAVEHSTRGELPLETGELVRVDVRRYGESSLSFYRRVH